jgi:hypothetical protein
MVTSGKGELPNGSGNNSKSGNFTLYPGMTQNWEGLSITPLAISQAPAPILGEEFLTDGQEVAVWSGNSDLECYSPALAEGFNCTLASTACASCEPDADLEQVNCQCRHQTFENKFLDLGNFLGH